MTRHCDVHFCAHGDCLALVSVAGTLCGPCAILAPDRDACVGCDDGTHLDEPDRGGAGHRLTGGAAEPQNEPAGLEALLQLAAEAFLDDLRRGALWGGRLRGLGSPEPPAGPDAEPPEPPPRRRW